MVHPLECPLLFQREDRGDPPQVTRASCQAVGDGRRRPFHYSFTSPLLHLFGIIETPPRTRKQRTMLIHFLPSVHLPWILKARDSVHFHFESCFYRGSPRIRGARVHCPSIWAPGELTALVPPQGWLQGGFGVTSPTEWASS